MKQKMFPPCLLVATSAIAFVAVFATAAEYPQGQELVAFWNFDGTCNDHSGALPEIVFAERHPGRDPSRHYYANFGYACTNANEWLHGADGARLCRLDPNSGELRVLLDDPHGGIRDPQVSYDAKRILFSYRKGGTHHYNLYEINADGTGLRQITGTDDDPLAGAGGRMTVLCEDYESRHEECGEADEPPEK